MVGPSGAPPEVVTPAIGTVAVSLEPDDLAAALDRSLALAEDPSTAEACRAVAGRFDWDDAIAPLLEDLYASDVRR